MYEGMCISCGHILSYREIEEYRQYAFLNNSKVLVKSTHGHEMVKTKKDDLIRNKKLVLVLDLDNTLLHSKELGLKD